MGDKMRLRLNDRIRLYEMVRVAFWLDERRKTPALSIAPIQMDSRLAKPSHDFYYTISLAKFLDLKG